MNPQQTSHHKLLFLTVRVRNDMWGSTGEGGGGADLPPNPHPGRKQEAPRLLRHVRTCSCTHKQKHKCVRVGVGGAADG